MGDIFTPLDLVIFFAALIGAMAVGLVAGRKEETSEDYFLAGRKLPWWGVAGSIFGSNVSANHMVGMMGIGFSVGFAQSHFELGAIFGLLALCYGFLPVYRKLNLYTLSEYLGRRYDDRSRVSYAVIMVIIMAVVHLGPGLYIGSRTICVLLGGEALVAENELAAPVGRFVKPSETTPEEAGGRNQEAGVRGQEAGGSEQVEAAATTRFVVNRNYYIGFVLALAIISASYTIFGGLKAVVWTDVIQSILLLLAGIGVAILTFRAIGGWGEMMALDQAAGDAAKMSLYRPTNDPDLPWTGVFTGLIAMHFFYWGTNQFIVQRALAARSDAQARTGIVAAGFLKLLIPFFAIAAGVAAFYLFKERLSYRVAPDTAFSELVKLVVPMGYGIIGLISAGLIGAILSSIDSMMNSAATIVTVDVYQRYVNPRATHRQMILVGRLSIVAFVILATCLAIFVLDPNSEKNFFLTIADYQNYLTPGILVAFVLGMFWRRGTATAAFVTILAGIFFSWAIETGYNQAYGMHPKVHAVITGRAKLEDVPPRDLPKELQELSPDERRRHIEGVLNAVLAGDRTVAPMDDEQLPTQLQAKSFDEKRKHLKTHETKYLPVIAWLGPRLNFFHRVVGVLVLCGMTYVVVSLFGTRDPEKSRLVWTDLGGHAPNDLRNLLLTIAASIGLFALLGWTLYAEQISPTAAAVLAAGWTLVMFVGGVRRAMAKRQAAGEDEEVPNALIAIVREDRFWAGVLCALAVFMHYYFY